MKDNSTVGVLGSGIMGAAMARNLLKAGMELRVWNRTREKAQPLADAQWCVSDHMYRAYP
jgi:3-hydroxyisobutyrate dehydrogenase